MVVLVGLIAYPFFSAILLSFQEKLVGTPGVWVGLRNNAELLVGRDLSGAFFRRVRLSLLYTAAALALKLVIGMPLPRLLHERSPGRTMIRACSSLPWAVPTLI